MTTELAKELEDIEAVAIDRDKLAVLTSEEDFTGLGVDLLVEVGSYVCVAASLLPGNTKCWNRDQAIIGGNVVRLFKLISALLDQTCQRRRETTFIFARLGFETIVNIRYLMKCASSELFDSYVRYSHRHEKKLHDLIHQNIKVRGGEELPIETRMLNSIRRMIEKSGVALADILPNKPKNWGGRNLFERAQEVGLDDIYLAAFGGGSHTIHGNWMDLTDYHLDEQNHGFGPHLEWREPRPQILFMIGLLTTEAIGEYFMYIGGEAVARRVDDGLDDLYRRIRETDEAHEEFITEKMSENGSA